MQSLKQWYGFWIGAAFSGVVGVGFYPILGSRVWCHFGCPQAAILGLINAGLVGSGLPPTVGSASLVVIVRLCEMGIDVKRRSRREGYRARVVWLRNVRPACRGRLKLENGPRISSTR